MSDKSREYLNSLINKKNFILAIIFFVSLIFFLRIPLFDFSVYLILLIGLGIFLLFKGFSVLSGMKDVSLTKQKLYLGLFYVFVFLTVKNAFESKWFIENIDISTYLSFGFIPLIFLFGLKPNFTGVLSIFFIILMALYSLLNYEIITENFAILAYLFFSISVFQQMILLVKNKEG